MITMTSDHRYVDDITGREYPSVTQTIRDAGLMGYLSSDEWYLDRGTAVHEATALFDEGVLDESELDPRLIGYVDAWKKFRTDSAFKPTEIEKIVLSERYGYAGTIDRDGIDIKTGAPCPWHELQAAAYWYALCPKLLGCWMCVYLHDDGTYLVKTIKAKELHNLIAIFASALAINNWKKEHKI